MLRLTIAMGACLLLLVSQTVTKTFNECDLAEELMKKGFPEKKLKEWICIIENESAMETNVTGGPDPDGSYDYGLFQINDRFWCNAGNSTGKACNVSCSDLLLDDITAAARCALKIYRKRGFGAWVGWQKCKDQDLQELDC